MGSFGACAVRGEHRTPMCNETTPGDSSQLICILFFVTAVDYFLSFLLFSFSRSPTCAPQLTEMATPEGGEGTTQANPAAVAQANPAAVANPAVAEIKAALIEVLRENPALLRLPEDPRVCTGMFIAEAWGVGLYGGSHGIHRRENPKRL